MNFRTLMSAATLGNPRRLYPLVGWTFLEYLLRGTPYGILLFVILELFKPLQSPGIPLQIAPILLACAGFLVALVLLYFVGRKAYFTCYNRSYELCSDGRLSIARHLKRLPMGFYNARDPGDIGAYLVTDYANVEFLTSHLLPSFVGALAMPLVLLVGLAVFDWRLALAAALVIPLAIPTAWISIRLVIWLGRRHQKTKVEAIARMIEYIQGIKLIKAFNLGGQRFTRLDSAFRRLRDDSIRLEGAVGPTVLVSSLVLHAGLPVILLLGLTFLLSGSMPLPVYLMFVVLGGRIYEPLFHGLMFLAEMNYMNLGVERIDQLHRTPTLMEGRRTAKAVEHFIHFDHVDFRYHDTWVLRDFSLTIPTRTLTALVGPSGSGKTTVTRLAARFWDVDKGSLQVGGHDIREYTGEDLLGMVSMVFQDVYLFHDTIYNNIRIGRESASQSEIETAARIARCHDFIMAFPDGYDTMVGEGGSTLSGGEKQRISIARAILKDAPIVMLDEATASLDPENEWHIQQAIDSLVKNRTVIVIAHRLHTIIHADQIAVIDKGELVELGCHEELICKNGLYQNLWKEQERVKGWKF